MTRPENRLRTRKRREPRASATQLAGVALSLALIIGGVLYPFDIFPVNGVRWLDEGGLAFDGAGIGMTDPLDFGGNLPLEEVTIELWIRVPKSSRNWGPRNFLSLWDGRSPPTLAIGTQANRVFAYSRYEPSAGSQHEQFHPEKRLRRDVWHFITVRYGADRVAISLDGKLLEERRTHGHAAFSGRLVVGDSPTTRRGVEAEFRGVAIFRRALSDPEIGQHFERSKKGGMRAITDASDLVLLLPLDEGQGSSAVDLVAGAPSLRIPHRYHGLADAFLDPGRASRQLRNLQPLDISVNVALFALFGWFAAEAVRPRLSVQPLIVVAAVTVAGFLLSLSLEFAQVLSPTRVSDFADLLWNTVGGALGAAAAWGVRQLRER
jgi:hypothetical protein